MELGAYVLEFEQANFDTICYTCGTLKANRGNKGS